MFRILLQDEANTWKIGRIGIMFSHDAIRIARELSTSLNQPYRLEEYDADLPECRDKKHYAIVLDPGVLNLTLSGVGG